MDAQDAIDLGRQAIWTALLISSPVLLAGMLVGLVFSLFQSMTQLQEQTLSFVPKIVAMVGVSLLLVPCLASRLIAYAQTMLGELPF